MRFDELFEGIPCRHAVQSNRDTAGLEIARVITSAADGAADALYVAVPNAFCDGLQGAYAAYAAGCRLFLCSNDISPGEDATVLLCDEPLRHLGELSARAAGYPARGMSVIGIVGDAGKTSVCLLLREILERAGRRVGLLTSDGIYCAGEFTPREALVPNAADVQRTLQRMAAQNTEVAVLELSRYQLAHLAANGIPFVATALTSLLAAELPQAEQDAVVEFMRQSAAFSVMSVGCEVRSSARRVLYLGDGGDFCATERECFSAPVIGCGTRFLLREGDTALPVTLQIPGEYAVENALLAAALARILGVELQKIAQALSAAHIKGRLECVAARADRLVYIDAAYTPGALQRVLCTLREITKNRLCVLLGSVGGRAMERRAELGRVAGEFADFVYLTSDDPDAEDPTKICADMLEGVREIDRTCVIPSRRDAIARAVRELRPGDVLLLAGKGADEFHLVGGVRHPFCEAQIVREVLAEL